MAERHLRKYSTTLAIQEMQIKTILRFYLTPVRMAKIKNSDDTYAREDMGKREHSCIVGGNANWSNPFGYHYGHFSEN